MRMLDPFFTQQHRPCGGGPAGDEDIDRLRRALSRELAGLDEEADANMGLMRLADDLLSEIQADMGLASEEDVYRIGQLRNASFDDAQRLARRLDAEREDAAQRLRELNSRE